ncbi:ParB/RepB/Spo0J family partition protein [Brevundimonas sp.]|uniref:ParB/RepB/Spo0J family partition protein n=1 Tax=Brevundimonas sp. TaxID=1871086 RepID=UPI002D3001C9|nr:ParB N-terminal domain-containing protein [Brevundimonas sp.]HYD26932.1 ParB N-terminal domain-containing protein [Brevundimonas sp.]
MSSITPTVLAVSNAPLIRWIAENPGAEPGWTALGRAVGRDTSNVARSVAALRAAGFVAADSLTLTAAGRALLPGLDALEGRSPAPPGGGGREADGGGNAAPTAWPHDRLRPNPLNPRKAIDPVELEGLAETIVSGRQIQPVVTFPADEHGVRTLRAGERRWRAVGLLIEQGRLPAGHPMPFVEAPSEPGQEEAETLLDALVENGQRANLPALDEAQAYAALIERTGWSAAEAARRTGKHVRLVQEAVQIIRKATPEAIAAHKRGEMTWEALRESCRDLDLTDKLALVLVELADKVETDGVHVPASWAPKADAYRWAELVFVPRGGGAATLYERGLIELIERGPHGLARVRTEDPRVERWLAEHGFHDRRAELLAEIRTAVVGDTAAKLAADEGFYVTDFLRTVDPAQTALEDFTTPGALRADPADAADALQARVERENPVRDSASPPPPGGGGREADGGGSADAPTLKPRTALALIELARACQTRDLVHAGINGSATQVHQEWTSAEFCELLHHKLAKTVVLPGKPRAAMLTDAGRAELVRRGWAYPTADGAGIHYNPKGLDAARQAAGLPALTDDTWHDNASAFLDLSAALPPRQAGDLPPLTPAPDILPPDRPGEPGAMDAEVSRGQELAARAARLVAQGVGSDEDIAEFRELLLDCIGEGPVQYGDNGYLLNAREEVLAVIDPEGDQPYGLEAVLAMLTVYAVNGLAGLPNPFKPKPVESTRDFEMAGA